MSYIRQRDMAERRDFIIFDALGYVYSFNSNEDYLEKRKSVDEYVHEDEFQGDRKEKRVLLQYLDRLVENTQIEQPHSISKSEQPDFIVETDGSLYGIELTLSTNVEYRAAWSRAQKRGKGEYPINTYFGHEKRVGKKNLERTFQQPGEPLRGMPVYGNYGEQQCYDGVLKAVEKKLEHLNHHEYQGIEHLELIVYENGPYSIYARIKDLRELFLRKTDLMERFERRFNRVHYLKGNSVIQDIFNEGNLFLKEPYV